MINIDFHDRRTNDFLYKNATIKDKNGSVKEIYFRFPLDVADQITDRTDPFVFALLFTFMQRGGTIKINGTVSRSVYDNATHFCRIWHEWVPDYCKTITLEAKVIEDDYRPSNKKLITAFSGGVDGSYTLYKYKKNLDTHFTYECDQAIMIWGADIPLSAENEFKIAFAGAKKMTDSLGVRLIPIKTNIRNYLGNWEYAFGSLLAGTLNFFSKKYFYGAASDHSIKFIHYPWGSNPISDPFLSSDTFRYISDGQEHTRSTRVQHIKDWSECIANLRVCWSNSDKSKNCGFCEKCVRTKLNFLVNGITHLPTMSHDFTLDDLKNININQKDIRFWEEIYQFAKNKNSLSSEWLTALGFYIHKWKKPFFDHDLSQRYVRLNNIIKSKTSILFDYDVSPTLQAAFNLKENFSITYDFSGYKDVSLLDVPDALLVIPFLGNVLPITWLLDAKLYVPEIDKDFYDAIPKFKKGFMDMYPNITFSGEIIVDKIVQTHNTQQSDGDAVPIAFFSNGIDAWHTLIRHRLEKPILLAMIGADIYLENKAGANVYKEKVAQASQQYGSYYVSFTTKWRKFINEDYLNMLFQKKLGFHYFHRIQHGLGTLVHAAPLAYFSKSKIIYFASSFSKHNKNPKIATHPSIDNHVTFSQAHVIHDGFDFTRQEKIKYLVQFFKNNPIKPYVHVCWIQNEHFKNCCSCEKCMRTMTGLIVAGANPREYGFQYNDNDFYKQLKKLLHEEFSSNILFYWTEFFQLIRKYNITELRWMLDYELKEKTENTETSSSLIMSKYIKYKILSKITFGDTRTYYKTKYKEQKNLLKSFNENIN